MKGQRDERGSAHAEGPRPFVPSLVRSHPLCSTLSNSPLMSWLAASDACDSKKLGESKQLGALKYCGLCTMTNVAITMDKCLHCFETDPKTGEIVKSTKLCPHCPHCKTAESSKWLREIDPETGTVPLSIRPKIPLTAADFAHSPRRCEPTPHPWSCASRTSHRRSSSVGEQVETEQQRTQKRTRSYT